MVGKDLKVSEILAGTITGKWPLGTWKQPGWFCQ